MDSNEQTNQDFNEDYREDPALVERVRQDIRAALTPESVPTFRSRRSQIMEQLRAEQNGTAKPLAPISLADRRGERAVEVEPTRRVRSSRSSLGWFTAVAAAMVLVLIGGIIVIALNTGNSSLTSSTGAANQAMATAAPNAERLGAATTAAMTTAAAATTAAMTTAAATTVTPQQFAAAMATTAAATTSAAGKAALTTAAADSSANTGGVASGGAGSASNTAVTTAASATTAASRTTAAATTMAATTAASATTAAATTMALPVPLATPPQGLVATLPPYPGTQPVAITSQEAVLRTFIEQQAANYGDQSNRAAQGLAQADIERYKVTEPASQVAGVKADDVLNFYLDNALRQGYTVEASPELQNDTRLRVRWLYLSKGASRVAVLVIEQLGESNLPLPLPKGQTGIFFLTIP